MSAEPIRRVACPHCGASLRVGAEFCPSCLGAVPPSAALVNVSEGELPVVEAPAIPDLDPASAVAPPAPIASTGVDPEGRRLLMGLGAMLSFLFGLLALGIAFNKSDHVEWIAGPISAGLGILGSFLSWRIWASTRHKDTLPSLADHANAANIFELQGADVQVLFVSKAGEAKQGDVFTLTVMFQNCSDQRRTVRVNVESDLPNTAQPQHANRLDGLTFAPSAEARMGPGQLVKVIVPVVVGVKATSHGHLRVFPGADGPRGNRVRHWRAGVISEHTGFKFAVKVQANPSAIAQPLQPPRWQVMWTPKPEQLLGASGTAKFL